MFFAGVCIAAGEWTITHVYASTHTHTLAHAHSGQNAVRCGDL